VGLVVAAGAGIVVLGHAAPLTYDEAFNRLHYSQFGIAEILGTYDVPNNHLPFTVIQSLVPAQLLSWDPWTIRIFGVLTGFAMVAAVLDLAGRRRTTPFVGLFAVAGSPILVSYLFVSRGYTFSGGLLTAAAAVPVALRRRAPVWGICLGASALALGTWPLPIYIYAAPGWILGVFAVFGLRAAAIGTGVYAVEMALLFAPIEGQIRAQSKHAWAGHQPWWSWVGDVFAAMNCVPVLLALVVVVVGAAAFTRIQASNGWRSIRDARGDALLGLIAVALSCSWFLLVGLTYAAGIETLPFVRTAVPALWVGLVALVAMFPRGRLEYLGVALLLPGCVWAAMMWTEAVHSGDWKQVASRSRNSVLYETTPVTIRDLEEVDATRIVCSSWDSWTCGLVAPSLEQSGVRVVIPRDFVYRAGLRCALGSHRPPPPWQVSVYRNKTLLGVLCH
jgi:hypothetical protein